MDWTEALNNLGTGWLITLVILFAGVLYWGFGSRRRQGREQPPRLPDDPA